MSTTCRLRDNTLYEPGQTDDPGIADLLSTGLASELVGRSLGDVVSRGSVLVFPPTLGDSEDLDEGQVILERSGEGIRTGTVMGFIGMGDDELTICSRFSGDDEDDYFLNHMLQCVFAPNALFRRKPRRRVCRTIRRFSNANIAIFSTNATKTARLKRIAEAAKMQNPLTAANGFAKCITA